MRNKQEDTMKNNFDNEPSRRESGDNGYGSSSSGRTSETSDIEKDSELMDRPDRKVDDDSSSGRH